MYQERKTGFIGIEIPDKPGFAFAVFHREWLISWLQSLMSKCKRNGTQFAIHNGKLKNMSKGNEK
jgi:hypothetical protein